MRPAHLAILILAAVAAPPVARAQELNVVTSLTTYAAIAREVAGPRATVTAIANGSEDPHFVQPKPSFVALLSRADVFVTTGLDLELWVPALLDKANNRKIREGSPGYVAAYAGIRLIDVPATVSRAEGDIHIYGNPHIWNDPINAVLIARNIAAGLKRMDPAHAAEYDHRAADFAARIARSLVGDELAALLGPETVIDLGATGQLHDFLRTNRFEGRPLLERLGGWLSAGRTFRERDLVCYHKEWDYFNLRFGSRCISYIEPKPGIPPTPRHVQEVIQLMRERDIPVLLSANYFDRNQVNAVARRTGARPVIVPTNTESVPGITTYFELVDLWIRSLAAAIAK